ncbi:MAG: glycosyltransferase family 2 protein [Candidatus Woesearchaeota archaeon]
MQDDISIVIPVYNEERSVRNTILGIKEVSKKLDKKIEILIVNDCSIDNSGKILNSIKGIKVIHHNINRGYGAALKTGIKASKGNNIMILDADGTYPLKDIPRFIKLIDNYDMVIGDRRKSAANVPMMRRPAKFFLNNCASYLAGKKIPDLNCGMRIFNKEKCLEFWNLYPNKFSFTSTITMSFICNGYKVKYIPIKYFKRKGKSTISPFDFYNFIQLLLRLTLLFNPLKIFSTISILLFLAGLVITVYSYQILGRLMDVTVLLLLLSGLQIFLFGIIAHMISKYWVKK